MSVFALVFEPSVAADSAVLGEKPHLKLFKATKSWLDDKRFKSCSLELKMIEIGSTL